MAATDFQKNTAERIMSLFIESEPQHSRVLLADEVGLGKTIVAKEVVSLMREWRKSVNDDFFKVVYICSNINIAKQNISKLGITQQLDVSESRLSMQHFQIAKYDKKIKEAAEAKQIMPEQIIPLTPNTSFDFGRSCGTANERGLIYALLSRRPEFAGLTNSLSEFLRGYATKDNWKNYYITRYTNDLEQLGESYVNDMWEKLCNVDRSVVDDLIKQLSTHQSFNTSEICGIISRLRKAYAQISIEMLDPDFVIMDEFQRFKNLIIDNEDEQSMLAKAFFERPDTKILLLSATPYKPYSTLEELNETAEDEHFSEFKDVINFLDKEDEENKFDEIWSNYGIALSHLSTDNYEIVLASKAKAEDALYNLMCRTERFNSGIIESKEETLAITPNDIKAYFQARKLLDEVNKHSRKKSFGSFPIEYVKSAPYLMSFMDQYQIKEYIAKNLSTKILQENWDRLYLNYDRVNFYKKISTSNAKLEYLFKTLFEEQQAEKLLWVPASHPYYKTKGIFSKSKGFSKILVFSAWEMVPRMISVMLTYYAELIVHKELVEKNHRPGPYFKESKNRHGANRLSKLKDEDNPLLYPCKYLADLYIPKEHLGQDITEIQTFIKREIRQKIKDISTCHNLQESRKSNSAYIRQLMEMLDNPQADYTIQYIPDNAIDILTNAAIASPAICFYRLLKDKDNVQKASKHLITLFNRSDSAAILDLYYDKKSDNYVDEILEYCVEGNLQAVLDEYDHILEGNWDKFISSGMLDVNTLQVEMMSSDRTITKQHMRTSFAIPFSNAKMDDKSVAHTSNIMCAFNSPFWPFVLTTTSIGQEGLDFHWYARKLLHWNLPSNPVDMEQREGRVNRYKCLAIRQSLGQKYPYVFEWEDIFSTASKEFKKDNSDLVPYWCLPSDFPDECRKKVERIILQYPLSNDGLRYERLKKVLSLYRLTLGQPRQEELLDMLAQSKLTEEQISALMINLCPFDKSSQPG